MRVILIIFTLLIVNFSFGQRVIKNKNYSDSSIKTVAITPYFDNNGNPKNSINEKFEKQLSVNFEVCCQKDIEHNIISHQTFNKLVIQYLNNDRIQSRKNLFDQLNKSEIIELQNGFKNTDLLIITSPINQRKVSKINGSGNISLSGDITVFDLRTGEFIVFVSDTIKKKYESMSKAKEPLEELINSLIDEFVTSIE